MTNYEPESRGKKTSAAEKHQSAGCRYVVRSETQNVNGNDRKLHYWIRNCDCGQESDHSDMLEVESENLNKMEGVEVHLKEDCQWVQQTRKYIRTICFL